MKVIVFDLDDTLYDEMTYVQSGFRAVSDYLEQTKSIDAETSLKWMMTELQANGRGKVFDRLLDFFQVQSAALIKQCLRVYRSHNPHISLYADAVRCLDRLSGLPIYIVTDGNKHVQHAKLKALGLADDSRVRKYFITRRYGIHNEKPSPHCFLKICEIEQVSPNEVVYIGDNPNKDFVGIKQIGFRTVRILRGSFAKLKKPADYEADVEIDSLDQFSPRIF